VKLSCQWQCRGAGEN